LFFLESVTGLVESKFDSSDEYVLQKNLKNCSSKLEKEYQNILKWSFHSRKISFGKVDFSFGYSAENIWRIPKMFCSINFQKFKFLDIFFSSKILRKRKIQLWQAWGKRIAKSRYSLLQDENILKKAFLRKTNSQTRSSGPVEWSAVLTKLFKFFCQK